MNIIKPAVGHYQNNVIGTDRLYQMSDDGLCIGKQLGIEADIVHIPNQLLRG